jgi:hypothetical protein
MVEVLLWELANLRALLGMMTPTLPLAPEVYLVRIAAGLRTPEFTCARGSLSLVPTGRSAREVFLQASGVGIGATHGYAPSAAALATGARRCHGLRFNEERA